MKYYIHDIEYDCDDPSDLPVDFIVELPDNLFEDEVEYELSEHISNESGFCHTGFSVEVIE